MRKTFKYDHEYMSRNNCGDYFVEICKNYSDYCYNLTESARTICEVMNTNTGMNAKDMFSPFPSSHREGDRYNEKLWSIIWEESQNFLTCESILNWIHVVLLRIRNPKYVIMILNCYINPEMTVAKYARLIHAHDANELRKYMIDELKKVITDSDIIEFNNNFKLTQSAQQKLIDAKNK